MNTVKLYKIKGLFHFINNTLFDGELPTPEFYLFTANTPVFQVSGYNPTQIEGLCVEQGRHYYIGLHNKLRGEKIFNVLLHEMIHIWMIENNKGTGHSGWFHVWCLKGIETFYYKD